jgi:hypothetical protein
MCFSGIGITDRDDISLFLNEFLSFLTPGLLFFHHLAVFQGSDYRTSFA